MTIHVLKADVLASDTIQHGFFGRRGGVSTGLYASLNCGSGSGDDPASVAANRARVAAALDGTADRLMTPWQVHGATAKLVDSPWLDPNTRPKADALVTATPGLMLGVLTADCAPVLFADSHAGVVAAAHAGWRGALAGIIESTIAVMESAGAQRHHIRAAIGPCISQANYEVGNEFREEFLAIDPTYGRFFVDHVIDKHRFDLPGFVLGRLSECRLETIFDLSICTYADSEGHFSFRRNTHEKQTDYGRQISAIVAK
jgi:polyphenol oxidase